MEYLDKKMKGGNEEMKKTKLESLVYKGLIVDAARAIKTSGRVPLSMEGLLKGKINAKNSVKRDNEEWPGYSLNGYQEAMGRSPTASVTTNDAILYHPDGRIKIVSNSDYFDNIKGGASAWNGSLVLPRGEFDKADGVEFSENEVDRYSDCPDKNNPIMLALVNGNRDLISEYNETTRETKWSRYYQAYEHHYDPLRVVGKTSKSKIKNPDLEVARFCQTSSNGIVELFDGWLGYPSNLFKDEKYIIGVDPEAETCDETWNVVHALPEKKQTDNNRKVALSLYYGRRRKGLHE